ncbi:PAS domain S-box-containing protein [Algoriphagus ornithinivorans]|uniref:histidine kinase n=1 Tax=Algoriphagus ornithinivorans TaxID=226506 RepID=A0A1I5BQJ8_9BACT|nr:PAS domain S-box protein [Algoriphagus ornithinivorans]SFN77045.1 PAS domain S-box-containing protein [Algoriphagus ornithinivorans]
MNFSVFDYCSDLCWVVNDKLEIVYANPSYSSLIENFTGNVLKKGDSIFIPEFGEEYLSKWSFIYEKVFSGQLKEVEESFVDPSTGKKIFGIIKFDLITDQKSLGNLAFCRNTDVTNFVALRKEEKKLFEASLDVICSIDSNGNFVKVNAASKDLWGYEPEELEGTPYADLIYPEDIEKTSKVAEEILSGKKITTFENRYIRKDGKIAYNFWSARWDEQDQMMYCVARDGREKIENELLIHQNELRFKALVQEGSDLIAILDQEGNYKYVSPTSSSILGIEPHEFENRNAFEFIHPEDKERTMGFLNRIFEEQRVQVDPFRFQNNNGEWRWIETILTNMLDNQVVKGIVANSRDITEKVIEEQRLKLLENAINNTNDAILITEAEPMEEPGPKIVYANQAFLDASEYTLEEIIGQNPRILQGPKSDFEGLAEFGQKIRNWKPAEVTTVNYTKYGKEFWVNFSVSPVANHTGMFTHWVSIQKDVTEKKNIELKKELDSRINKIFRDKKSLKTALNGVCEELIEFLELEYTEFWLPTVSGDKLRRIANCFGSKSGEIFWKESKVYEQFNPNEGLPGEVWKKQKPISWKNISKDERFIRRKEAEKSGINSMAGIPIFHKGEISGVLLFGAEKPISELEAIFPVLNSLQGSLGIDLDKKKLENEVNLTFQSAPDLIALLDLSGNFLKINTTGSRFLNALEDEIRGRNLNDFSSISEPDFFVSSVKNKDNFKFKTRQVLSDKTIKWLSWSCEVQHEEGLVFATAKDITSEKQMAELLNEASAVSRVGGWEVDLMSNKIYWSKMVHEIHETNPDTYVPELEAVINFYRSDFRDLVKEKVDRAIQFGEPFDFEAILVTAEQNEIWVRSRGQVEFVDKSCVRIYGSFQDIHERKLLELRISEVLASISDAFYAVDSNWNFIYFNKEAENLLARKSEEVMGKNIWKEFPAAKGTQLEEIYLSVVNQNESKSFEYFYPGNNCWYEINAYPSNGGLSVYFKNIDERIKAKERLENAYQEKENILESIGDAFLAVNQLGQITYWNKRAEKLFGSKKASVLGKEIQEVLNDTYKMVFLEYLTKAQSLNQLIQFEEFFENKKKWIEGSIYPSDQGLSVYLKDITTRKETDIRLLRANERFEKVTEAATDGIWDWDIANDKFYRGKGFEKLYGIHVKRELSQEEFWKDKFHPEDLEGVKESLRKALENPKASKWEFEYRIMQTSGRIITVLDKGIIIRDEEKKPIRMVGAMTDITYRKEFEDELVKLNDTLKQHVKDLEIAYEELEQFTFIASHDLQEPLRMINSFLQLLKKKYEPVLDEKGLQYIHFATDGAVRMKQIILDLLEYSRAGKFKESPEKVDFNGILNDFKILRRKSIQEKGVKLHFKSLPEITVFKTPFVQVIHNLLDNAIKYSRKDESPEIKISVEEAKDHWQIQVKDNGIGIKEKYFEKIFIIFQRLHDRTEFSGTGIGLSIVKKNVESWGGKVWVNSELGNGTTFYFTIPKNIILE